MALQVCLQAKTGGISYYQFISDHIEWWKLLSLQSVCRFKSEREWLAWIIQFITARTSLFQLALVGCVVVRGTCGIVASSQTNADCVDPAGSNHVSWGDSRNTVTVLSVQLLHFLWNFLQFLLPNHSRWLDWLCTAFVSDVSVRQCSTVQSGLSQKRSMRSWLVLEWYLTMFPTPFNEPSTLLHVAPTRCRHNCRCHRQTMSYRETSVVDVRLLLLISMNSVCVVIAMECHGACCSSCSRLVCYPVLFAS